MDARSQIVRVATDTTLLLALVLKRRLSPMAGFFTSHLIKLVATSNSVMSAFGHDTLTQFLRAVPDDAGNVLVFSLSVLWRVVVLLYRLILLVRLALYSSLN